MFYRRIFLFQFIIFVTLMIIKEGKAKKLSINNKQQLVSRETNPISFVGLLLMRLFYGITKVFGWDVSEWFGGALVPPGAEDEDDYDDFL